MQIKEVENVVKLIKSFDPPGIGARNLKECLIIQLNNIEKKNKEELVALNIINNFYDDFINKHYDKIISKLSNTKKEIIKKGIQIIKNLNPKPGGSIDESQHTEYLIPDFILKKDSPNTIIGFFDSIISFDNSLLFSNISLIVFTFPFKL